MAFAYNQRVREPAGVRVAVAPVPLRGKPFLFLNALAFSLDGSHLAVACSDGALRVCDVARLRWIRTLDGGERLTPDGFMAPITVSSIR